MGKTTDSIKKLQKMREGKYGLALKKSAQETAQAPHPAAWSWKMTLAFVIPLVMATNVVVFFLLKSYLSKEKAKVTVNKANVTKKSSAPKQSKAKSPKKTNSTSVAGVTQQSKKR